MWQQQDRRRSQCCRPSVFIKLYFVQLLVGLLSATQRGVDVWRGSGVFWLSSGTGQGTKEPSCYVPWFVSHTGAVLFPALHGDTFWEAYKCLPRDVFLQQGLLTEVSPGFLFGGWVGSGGIFLYVRENQSFKFLQVLQQLDLVSTLAVFYLGISPLAHTGTL